MSPGDYVPPGPLGDYLPGQQALPAAPGRVTPPSPLPPPSPEPPRSVALAPRRLRTGRLGLLPLIMVLFFSVSGGAYGLEEAVSSSGAGLTLLLLVLVPVVWTFPVTWMVSELSSAIPDEGGYYIWVRRGLGPFWGFLEGWWSWINSFVDVAIYPVLFVTYLSALLSKDLDITALEEQRILRWLVTLAVIWSFTYLNIRGVRLVGWTSVLFGVFIFIPFTIMVALGLRTLFQEGTPIWQPFVPEGEPVLNAFGLGLFVVLWNYLGWDGPTTISGEVEEPRRAFRRAMTFAVPLVIIAYILPVAAGLTGERTIGAWTDGSFPRVAAAVGGERLGTWIAVGGVVSAAGLFSALLLASSRLPYVLARDRYLPAVFERADPRYGTPVVALIVTSAIYSVFTWWDFADLVELDVIIYAAALFLEFAALIALRLREPRLPRPSRVPGGWPMLIAITLAPVAVFALAVGGTVSESGLSSLALPAAVLLSGPLLYPLLRNRF